MDDYRITVDDMPKYDFGVGTYGGYWPDGTAVENPCCKCRDFLQCVSPYRGNKNKDCFTEK